MLQAANNIYFICVSMQHLFTGAFIAEKYHHNGNKTLVIPNHMKRMVEFIPHIEAAKVWDKIIVIDTEGREYNFIKKEIERIFPKDEKKLYIFGYDFVTFLFLHNTTSNDSVAIIDEGIAVCNVPILVKRFYDKTLFENKEYPFEKIDELWLLKPELCADKIAKNIIKLSIAESLEEQEFKNDFFEKIKILFNVQQGDIEKLNKYDAVFFDSYLSINNFCPASFEDVTIKIFDSFAQDFKMAIKPHPNEMYWQKYDGINAEILKDNFIPWEVLHLLEGKKEKRVCFSHSSGSLIKQRFICGDNDSYLIYLCFIYKKYFPSMDNSICGVDIIQKFAQDSGDKKIFFPKTFEELAGILENIGYKCDAKKAVETMNDFFANFYYDNIAKLHAPMNVSTIYFAGKEINVQLFLTQTKNSFELIFDFEKARTTLLPWKEGKILWYVLRAIAIKTKPQNITVEYDDKTITYNSLQIKTFGIPNSEGYYIQNCLDSIYCLPFDYTENIKRITIDAEIVIFDSYTGLSDVFRNSLIENGSRIGELSEQNTTLQNININMQNEKNILETRCAEYETTVNNLQTRCAEYETTVNNLQTRCAEYETTVNNLQSRCMECETHINNLQGLYDSLKDEHEKLRRNFFVRVLRKLRLVK